MITPDETRPGDTPQGGVRGAINELFGRGERTDDRTRPDDRTRQQDAVAGTHPGPTADPSVDTRTDTDRYDVAADGPDGTTGVSPRTVAAPTGSTVPADTTAADTTAADITAADTSAASTMAAGGTVPATTASPAQSTGRTDAPPPGGPAGVGQDRWDDGRTPDGATRADRDGADRDGADRDGADRADGDTDSRHSLRQDDVDRTGVDPRIVDHGTIDHAAIDHAAGSRGAVDRNASRSSVERNASEPRSDAVPADGSAVPLPIGGITGDGLGDAVDRDTARSTSGQPLPARTAGEQPGSATPSAGPDSAGQDTDGRERLVSRERAESYGSRWDRVKGGFVDEPSRAVADADKLVGELLDELQNLFTEQRKDIERSLAADETSTEDMRLALRRYRSFFDRLLSI